MITDKEYPATHSMETAWYCVDLEGNVAVFDIEDNGPVPDDSHREYCVNEVITDAFPQEGADGIYDWPLTDDQIEFMLLPKRDKDKGWEKKDYGWRNFYWSDIVIQIDMNKYDILLKAIALKKESVICLSRELGFFALSLYDNKAAVELLQANNVIQAIYYFPTYFMEIDDVEPSDTNSWPFPFYIFHQGYSPGYKAAVRVSVPKHPMKIDQLSPDVRKNIKTLPLKFSEEQCIQIAEYIPILGVNSVDYVYDKKRWAVLAKSDGTIEYYNVGSQRFITEEKMQELIRSGLAEEYDYDKHHDMNLD